MLPAYDGRWRWWGEDGAGGTRTWRRGVTEGARGAGEGATPEELRSPPCAENVVEPGAAAQHRMHVVV